MTTNIQAMPAPSEAIETVENSTGETFNLGDAIAQKRAMLATASASMQAIAEAMASQEKAGEEIFAMAQQPTIDMAEAMAAGLVSKEEANEVLIGAFGRGKPKKDGSPSKSPAKEGLYYRKRWVTLSEAIAYADAGEIPDNASRWASDKDINLVSGEVAAIRGGDAAPFTAYDALTKKKKKESLPLHFDTDKLAKLAEDVAANFDCIQASPELVTIYGALSQAIELVKGNIDC